MTVGSRVEIKFAGPSSVRHEPGRILQIRRNLNGTIHRVFVRRDDGRVFVVAPESLLAVVQEAA